MKRSEFAKLVGGLAVLAAFLPVAIYGVVNKNPLRLNSQAGGAQQLRIWFEPAEVILSAGAKTKLKIMGEYSEANTTVPGVSIKLTIPEGLTVAPTELFYNRAFSGRTELGEIMVEARESGRYTIYIAGGDAQAAMTGIPVVTAKSVVVVP